MASSSVGRDEILQKIEENKENIAELKRRFSEQNPQDAPDSPYDPRDFDWLDNDAYMYHLLLISQMNLDTALVKLDKILRWRKEFGVNDIRFEDFPEDIQQQGPSYPHGTDKKERRILWYLIKHYHKSPETQMQAKKMTVFWLNKLQKDDAADRIVIMQDMTDAGVSNMDIELVKFNIMCYELYFPAIVEMLYIVDMPWILNAVWRIVEKLLSQQARDHIKFIRGKEVQMYFDLDSLPPHLGGTDPYVWEYIPGEFDDDDDDDDEEEEEDERGDGGDGGDVSFRSLEGDDRSLLPIVNAAKSLRQSKQHKRVHFQDEVDGKENVDPEHSPLHKKHHRKAVGHKRSKSKEIHVGPHISIRPGEVLMFEPPTSISGLEGISARLNITNVTDKRIVYKVKTTTPERYKVRPSMGPVNPGASISINISLLSGPGESVIRDKFLILSSDPGEASFKTNSELTYFWKNAKPEDIVEHRMSCVFRPSKSAKGDATDTVDKSMKTVLSKLQHLESEVCELRRQNSRLLWLQLLIFILSVVVLIHIVFFQPSGGTLLAHSQDLYAAQNAPCAEATEKFLRGAREGL